MKRTLQVAAQGSLDPIAVLSAGQLTDASQISRVDDRDYYTTRTLAGILDCTRPESDSFFCGTIFSEVMTFDTEEVMWDRVYDTDQGAMAPFVCPCVQAPNIAVSEMVDSISFSPAYIKIKSTINACKPLPMRAGERQWGDLTQRERFTLHLGQHLAKHERMIERREEWMAASALVNARYIVSGELYKPQLVDFCRDENLTWTTKSEWQWTKDSCGALNSLQDAYDRAFCIGNCETTDVMMNQATWDKFIRTQDIKEWYSCHCFNPGRGLGNPGPEITYEPRARGSVMRNARFVWNMGGVNFWVVNNFYWALNSAGQKCRVPFIPDGKVVGIGLGEDDCCLRPMKLYGAIQDCQVLQPLQRFQKTWEQEDPSACFVMTQTAPLPIVLNANASWCMTVC